MLAAEPTERPKVIGVTDPIICSKQVIHALDEVRFRSVDEGLPTDGSVVCHALLTIDCGSVSSNTREHRYWDFALNLHPIGLRVTVSANWPYLREFTDLRRVIQ